MFNTDIDRLRLLSDLSDKLATYDLYSYHKRKSFRDEHWEDDKSIIQDNITMFVEQGDSKSLEILWEIRDADSDPDILERIYFDDLENKWAKNNKIVMILESSPSHVLPRYLVGTIYESLDRYTTISFYREHEVYLKSLVALLDKIDCAEIISLDDIIKFLKGSNFIEGFDFSYAINTRCDSLDFILYLSLKDRAYLGINPCSKRPAYRKPMLRSQQICGLKIGPKENDSLTFFGMSCDAHVSPRFLKHLKQNSDDISHSEIICLLGLNVKPTWFTFTFHKNWDRKDRLISFTFDRLEGNIIIEITDVKNYGSKIDFIIHLPYDNNKRRSSVFFKNILIRLRETTDEKNISFFKDTTWIYDLIKDWKKALFYKERRLKKSPKDPLQFLKNVL
jgi:hypothetical protein